MSKFFCWPVFISVERKKIPTYNTNKQKKLGVQYFFCYVFTSPVKNYEISEIRVINPLYL